MSPTRSSSSPTRTPLEKKKKSERSYISSAAETVRRQRRSTTTTPCLHLPRRCEQMKTPLHFGGGGASSTKRCGDRQRKRRDEKGGILLIIVYNYNINFFFQEDGISINGCFSASFAEIRFEGSKRKHLSNKSLS